MAAPREKFFSLPSLLIVAALIGLALYALFPRQAVFENVNYLDHPDALSIAYLDVLLRADPDNTAVRINLARMLRVTGQNDRAEAILRPLMQLDAIPSLAFGEYINLLRQRVFAAKPGPDRDVAERELYLNLLQLPRQDYPFERRMALLDSATDAITPLQSQVLLRDMLAQASDAGQRQALRVRLARIRESQGAPAAAAQLLSDNITDTPPAQQPALFAEIIRLQLASGEPGKALRTFKSRVAKPKMDTAGLEQGIRLARLAGSPDDAQRWLGQLAAQKPDNVPLQREYMASLLASGDLDRALGTARRMQRHPDQLTDDDRQQIAQLLEWTDHPDEALAAWIQIYRQTGSTRSYDRAHALAQSLFDWQTLEALLRLRNERGQLDEQDYALLADTHIRDGNLDAAKTTLSQGLKRYPQSVALRDRQLVLLLNSRDFEGAIALLEDRNDLTDEQRFELANLYWHTRQPEKAFDQLQFQASDPALNEQVVATRLALGTYLGRTDQLRDDYQNLMSLADDPNTSPAILEQLIQLAVRFGDFDTAYKLSQNRYAKTGELRYLINSAEYQAAMSDWPGMSATLDQWAAIATDAEDSPRYWTLRALAYHQQDQLTAADAAYRRAHALLPNDTEILIGWSWLQISDIKQFRDTLRHLLAQLSENPDSDTYPVLAYGYSALGEPRVARDWFLLGLDSNQDDQDWLLSTATTLEQTGSPLAASKLRQSVDPDRILEPEQRVAYYEDQGLHRLAWHTLAQAGRTPAALSTQNRLALSGYALDQDNTLFAEAMLAQIGPSRRNDIPTVYPPQESRAERARRLRLQLDQLESANTPAAQSALVRDTVELHKELPRTVQMGTERLNLGNFAVQQSGAAGRYAFNVDDHLFVLDGELRTLHANGAGRLRERPANSVEGTVALTGLEENWSWELTGEQLARAAGDELAGNLEINWQPVDRWSLTGGIGRNERTPDTAESWWLLGRDREYLGASYTPFSRLTLSAQLQHLSVQSSDGNGLGDGYATDLTGTYTVFRQDPAMTVTLNYQRQQLDLTDPLPADVLAELDQPLAPSELLTDEYERIGMATRWFHGEPHALYRTTPSPRAFLELGAGYVLSTNTPEVGVGVGLGWRLTGDDELALSGRWTSEGLDGNGRADLNLTYTLYLGR
ncbi:tetratricopeptide repeat protein [Marinobacter sp. 1Y8]